MCRSGETAELSRELSAGGVTTSLVKRTLLAGGLRVITDQMVGVRSASLAVFVAAGSRHEEAGQHGCSHFLEHLLFKGTATRSALDISSQMDELGGDFNAYTAKEYTCFHARVLDEDLPAAIDVLGDMLTSSLISAEDVEAERQVILDEIAMHEDDPDDVAHNLLTKLAWGDNGLGRTVAGTVDSITALTRDQIASFYRDKYSADQLVVAVAGNLVHEQVVDLVAAAFMRAGFLQGEVIPPAPLIDLPLAPVANKTGEVVRDLEQVTLMLGLPGVTRSDPQRYALSLLVTILGGGSSSRLFQEVRERRGLAYNVFAFGSHHADAGLVGVSVGTLPTRLAETLRVISGLLQELAADGVTHSELARAQSQLRGGLIMSMEDSGARAARLGKAELFYDELLSMDEIISLVKSVTREQIGKLATLVLTASPARAIVGPRHALAELTTQH
jgi:predicted Zn-dependent peptidase